MKREHAQYTRAGGGYLGYIGDCEWRGCIYQRNHFNDGYTIGGQRYPSCAKQRLEDPHSRNPAVVKNTIQIYANNYEVK